MEELVTGFDTGQSRKKRLLIVDDNKEFCEFVKLTFSEEFEMRSEEEGQPGLEKCSEWLPDAVLLDINMPSMNGIEFLRLMSRDSVIANIPVVIITASDFNGITESLSRRYPNVSAFMTKLSPIENLKEKILKAMAK